MAIARVQAKREQDNARFRAISEDSSAELFQLKNELLNKEKFINELKNEVSYYCYNYYAYCFCYYVNYYYYFYYALSNKIDVIIVLF